MAEHAYRLQWATLSPQNFFFLWGSGPHLIHDFLDPSEPKLHRNWFSPFCTAYRIVPPTLQWTALPPSKLPLPIAKSWAHPSPQSKRHLNHFNRFAGLTTVTDRLTGTLYGSVTNWLLYVVMQCGVIIIEDMSVCDYCKKTNAKTRMFGKTLPKMISEASTKDYQNRNKILSGFGFYTEYILQDDYILTGKPINNEFIVTQYMNINFIRQSSIISTVLCFN